MEPQVQQVVLPSLWPRKKNTRGPASDGTGPEGASNLASGLGVGLERDATGGERERDLREEAMRELEEDKDWVRSRGGGALRDVGAGDGAGAGARDGDSRGEGWRSVEGLKDWVRNRGERGNDEFEEGLRMRRREYDMPGGMPGMMMNFD